MRSLQVRGDVQGIATLLGRRLGKTLTIKSRVWDLAMFTIDTQDKKKMTSEDDRFMPSLLVSSLQFKLYCFFNQL